ncbi:tetratricopeptide repeat protein, partial [Vibrio harveyi]
KKGVFHYIASRTVHGVAQLSDLEITPREGDFIAIKVAQYNVKGAVRTRILSIVSTGMTPAQGVYKTFSSDVRESNGMGFTSNDIFISPPLMSKHAIEDCDCICGSAVLSLNKKRGDWGWKALTIDSV